MLKHLIVVFLALVVITDAFDKFSLSKDKNTRANIKHPISRRVLRYERSASFGDFPTPAEMPLFVPSLDFAKVRPNIPSKTKPNQIFDSDYMPEIDF
ncbi:unnamed protein product [Caenorhabditis bovis]|uniref:Uncharacterized protein n=1 Tax=Caenorhabditis bovis TaxID=2654633 RepID=A0A8S1ER32_9PELO|nr:unnamed protein product [Caenorhabditis bovis]